ncbi:MAG TPA: hypothetical protein DEO40_03710 [Treponema sp.]|nr:hypothetical protein [Treponema sp.]
MRMAHMKAKTLFAAGAMVLALVSCKTTQQEEGRVETENSGTVVMEFNSVTTDGQTAPHATAVTPPAESKSSDGDESLKTAQEKNARTPQTRAFKRGTPESRLRAKVTTDPYTGWIYVPERHFTLTNGDLKIELNGHTGTFALSAIPENSKPVSLLSTVDSMDGSYFSLKIDDVEYPLTRESGVKTQARRTPYGGQMAYTVPKKAEVIIDFSFLPSIATSSRVDMLRVTVYMINLGRTTKEFSVKALFDTVLGEGMKSHFSTRTLMKVTKETQFNRFDDSKWICSTDGKNAVQFLLEGEGLPSPQTVTLANKDTLSSGRWVPAIDEQRSFNSVNTYNNSAVSIIWPGSFLDPKQTEVVTFYISVATDGNVPAGEEFLASLKDGSVALGPDKAIRLPTSEKAPEAALIPDSELKTYYWENMPALVSIDNEFWNPENLDFENTPVIASWVEAQEGDETSNVEFEKTVSSGSASEAKKVSTLSGSGLNFPVASGSSKSKGSDVDMDYVRMLVNHIQSLESSSGIDEEEIKRLNAELDEIMAKLKGNN